MEVDDWKYELNRAAGIIGGVEIGHPGNAELRKAAAPFMKYVRGLGKETDEADGK